MSENQSAHWTLAEKTTFRFALILFSIFIFLFNNNVLPVLVVHTGKLSEIIVAAVSGVVLGPDSIPLAGRGGSGDTLFHYLLLLAIFIFSAVGCILWSVLDRARSNYNTLFYWLTVLVRFYVGIMLIHYGIAKIIKTQFASPDLMRLLSTYGESSPMGLAWTYLGFSDGYNLFMGIAEVSCGLLLFRRTAVLGAIIALMVSANVMAVNYFFDVPVKIISTALVVMSIFLLVPNFFRLSDFFLRGKSVSLRVLEPSPVKKRWVLHAKTTFKYLLIIICILPIIFTSLSRRKHYGDRAPKLPLYGVYTVDSFVSEKPILKWKTFIIQRSNFSVIKMEDGTSEYINLGIDTIKRELGVTFNDEPSITHRLTFHKPGNEYLEITGIYFGQPIKVNLKKQRFELAERQFNWISENPYNR